MDARAPEFSAEEQPVETTLYSLSDRTPDPVDRRDGDRYLTLFRVGSVMVDDRRELCLIKNISAGGMMIRPYCKLSVGTPLSVELKRGEQIPGVVSWINGDSAGISFDESIDVVELLASSMEGPRPRMPRIEVRCIASVRQGSNVYGMRAHDVSQGGLKVESARDLDVGAEVLVTLPGLSSREAIVRWRDGRTYGITFRRLVALAELVDWLREQRELLRTMN
nr:PilZ domain-containing protein [Sphingomonas sp.]